MSLERREFPQDFSAVVLVDNGEQLYPFYDGPNVQSTALLPIGNMPVINIVLDWIIDAGLMDILLVVPSASYATVSDHLAENYSSASHPRLRITLVKSDEREGSARILRTFKTYIKGDFCVIPCDIYPTDLSLTSLLDRHRANADAVLTSVFHKAEVEDRVLTAYDGNRLLMLEHLDDDTVDLRTTLLQRHPKLSLSTRLVDTQIYVCRRTILDLLATRKPRDLDDVGDQVLPWIVKGSWQRNAEWSKILSPSDPLADALAQSTARLPNTPWECQMVKDVDVMRANTLGGYWEINRRLIKSLPPRIHDSPHVSADSIIADSVKIGDRASLKKSIIGRHCVIGRGAKLSGCILWDFCTVDENARLDNVILCNNTRVGSNAQLKDCEFGPGCEVANGATLKNERLVASLTNQS